jgi:hypothetical protein
MSQANPPPGPTKASQSEDHEGDSAPALRADPLVQVMGVTAKGSFEIARVAREKEIAQGVVGRSAPEADAELRVQTLAMNVNESDDAHHPRGPSGAARGCEASVFS